MRHFSEIVDSLDVSNFNDLRGAPGLSEGDVARVAHALAGLLNPARAATAPKSEAKKKTNSERIKYLNDAQLAGFFQAVEAAGSPRDVAMFRLMYHRGLRASEVGLLKMEHLNLRDRRLVVPRKKHGRSVEHFLVDIELKVLRGWLRDRGSAEGPLFPSQRRTPIHRAQIFNLYRKYATAAALPEDLRHPHCLRHSCATSLLERDVDLREVQDHLGHRDIASTTIYAQVTDKKRRKTGERLFSEWK
jgi:integrase